MHGCKLDIKDREVGRSHDEAVWGGKRELVETVHGSGEWKEVVTVDCTGKQIAD